ncbi:hypothetical protein AVEN_161567-1 [Araneus ventricosus]|uniref:Uncharacterized protein n=1 Tax=Araneus ventricosus TaxID=182803 RepID=A0A4Y2FKP2_ARAVE|nr:hypothetical protein AVEN_161567-1 [Araneus ventricosus]
MINTKFVDFHQSPDEIGLWEVCPSVPLTVLERMLSSSLNMALSYYLKSFTCLTITAVVVGIGTALHCLRVFTVSWRHMGSQRQASNRMAGSPITSSPGIKFIRLASNSRSENRSFQAS